MTSDSYARAWWRLTFELRFEKSKAQAFEDLVRAILEHRYPHEYHPVKAAGSIGDMKCDGLLSQQGILIQCYGPERWEKSKATSKIDSDFAGALENWGDCFDTWVFAHNQSMGAPSYVRKHLQAITHDSTHGKSAVEWSFPQLRDLVFELSDEQLTDLLGPPLIGHDFRDAMEELHLIRDEDLERARAQQQTWKQLELPAVLRAEPDVFVNRVAELDSLDSAMQEVATSPACKRIVLSGLPAVGTSELVHQWVRHNDEHFDAVLLVDLNVRRDMKSTEFDHSEVLAELLRQLRVTSEFVPLTETERALVYGEQTKDRRVLLIVEGVVHESDVSQLTPAGAGSLMLVTSRTVQEGLILNGARSIAVDPLDDGASAELLSARIDADRLASDPDATNRLIEICGGHPLALGIAAARLNNEFRKTPVRKFVENIHESPNRLVAFSNSARDLGRVFECSYESLEVDAKHLYETIGILPMGTVDVRALAAANGVNNGETDARVAKLCRANLLANVDNRRYAMHGLVYEHAAATARERWDESQINSAVRRYVEWYVAASQRADRAHTRERLRVTTMLENTAQDLLPTFDDARSGMEWFATERDSLLAVLHLAATMEWDELLFQLADALWPFFHDHRDLEMWKLACSSAAEAAKRMEEPAIEARMRACLSRAYAEVGNFADATTEIKTAIERAKQADNEWLHASVTEFAGRT